MSDPIEIINGRFKARVLSRMVEVFIDGDLVDNPGPWDTNEAAANWAQLIVDSLASGKDHYGRG